MSVCDPAPLATAGAWLASFADVFQTVVGVILTLCGLGLLLMGLIALADRQWRHGGIATLASLAVLAAGFWLVGVFV